MLQDLIERAEDHLTLYQWSYAWSVVGLTTAMGIFAFGAHHAGPSLRAAGVDGPIAHLQLFVWAMFALLVAFGFFGLARKSYKRTKAAF